MATDLDIADLPKPWTERQFLFAEAYISEAKGNGAHAARLAGYSEKTAKSHAHDLLTNPDFKHVQDYIKFHMQELAAEFQVSVARTMKHQAAMAYSNITDFVDFDEKGGAKINLKKATRDQIAAIKSIKTDADGNVEIKLWDKPRSNEALMKHLGLVRPEMLEIAPTEIEASIDVSDKQELAKRIALTLRLGAPAKEKSP